MENKILNKIWIEWFVGFCDADANFQVFPKQRSYLKKDGSLSKYINIGYGFHISLSIRDSELLKDFQFKFNNIGHIYTYPEKEECRWAVTKKSELIYLIETAFSLENVILPLLFLLKKQKQKITKHQRERLARLKYVLINNIKRFETSDEFDKFLDSRTIVLLLSFQPRPSVDCSRAESPSIAIEQCADWVCWDYHWSTSPERPWLLLLSQ